MRKQLEQMEIELRELMVYQSPPELGALYTEVEAMMKEMGKTQKVLIARKMKQDLIDSERRRKRLQKLKIEMIWGISALFTIFVVWFLFLTIVNDRIKKYPQLGDGWIPKTEEQRKKEALPKRYTGR